MPDTVTHPTPDRLPSPPLRPSRRQRRLFALAAVATAAMIGVAGAAVFDDSSRDRGGESTPSAGGPVSPGSASCVATYNLETLARRQMAFDGTVEAVDGDRISFRVEEWYRGGDGDRVTLTGASTLAGLTSAGPALALERGTRLLVAGDGGFAWGCGFTQPYDREVASRWRERLS